MLTLQLIIFLFPLAYSPGPGNMFFAAIGAKFGVFNTLSCSLGYHIATWIVTFLIGNGFHYILIEYPNVFAVIGIIGSAYVFYLAWQFLQASQIKYQSEDKKIGIISGVLLLVLNPKAYLIILLMFSQFLDEKNKLSDIFWITTIFTLNNFVAFFIWAYIGDRLLARFRRERHAKQLNLGFACILFGVGIWLVMTNVVV